MNRGAETRIATRHSVARHRIALGSRFGTQFRRSFCNPEKVVEKSAALAGLVRRNMRRRALRLLVTRPAVGTVVWGAREWSQRLRLSEREGDRLSAKVRRKMRMDRRPLLEIFADKIAVRDHVAARVGARYLPQLLGIIDSPEGPLPANLPDRFVIKPSHGSGAAIIVHPAAAATARLPVPTGEDWWLHAITWVRRENLDASALAGLASHYLSRSYLFGGRAYWDLPRTLMIEEYLAGADDQPSPDYRLWTFHGRVRWIQVDLGWSGGLGGGRGAPTRSLHWPDWTPIDVVATRPRPPSPPEPPRAIGEMIQVAERLGAGTDMVRVDLYEFDGRVVFGELTSYPLGGRLRFDPPEYDRILGQWWHPPRRY
jgi:hypothetical protein